MACCSMPHRSIRSQIQGVPGGSDCGWHSYHVVCYEGRVRPTGEARRAARLIRHQGQEIGVRLRRALVRERTGRGNPFLQGG